MKATNKQRSEISALWFNSALKQSSASLVLTSYIQDGNTTFSVGVYSFDSNSGISYVSAIDGYKKLNYSEIKSLLS